MAWALSISLSRSAWDRPCALKVMMKELAQKPGFLDRFVREARAMAKINHPNVVQCYGVFEEKGLNFVAMELMDGQSKQDWTDELGKCPSRTQSWSPWTWRRCAGASTRTT